MLTSNLLPELVTPNPLIPTTLRTTLDLITIPPFCRGPGDVRLGAAAGREAVLDVLHARGAEEEGEWVQGGVLQEAEGCLLGWVSWGWVRGGGRRGDGEG